MEMQHKVYSNNLIGVRRNTLLSREHIMEYVTTSNGVIYIDDSAAISVDKTLASIASVGERIVLIIGGSDLKSDYTLLQQIVKSNVAAIIALNSWSNRVFESFIRIAPVIIAAGSVEESVSIAQKLAKGGDVVLFSPGCSSNDIFDNYKNRGDVFKQAVSTLTKKK